MQGNDAGCAFRQRASRTTVWKSPALGAAVAGGSLDDRSLDQNASASMSTPETERLVAETNGQRNDGDAGFGRQVLQECRTPNP